MLPFELTFSPLDSIVVHKFSTEKEAIEKANDTE